MSNKKDKNINKTKTSQAIAKTKDKKKTPKQIREEQRKKQNKNLKNSSNKQKNKNSNKISKIESTKVSKPNSKMQKNVTTTSKKVSTKSIIVQKQDKDPKNLKQDKNDKNNKINKKENDIKKQDEKQLTKVKNSKVVNKNKIRKEQKRQKKLEKRKNKKTSTVKKVILTILFSFIVICLLACGIVGGIVYGIIDEETAINLDDLTIKLSNSKIVSADGQTVLAELSGDEKRKIISIDEMSPYLPKAYVAIEDERFYQHHGVDIKRTASAIVYSLMGNSSYGGSTITQQLVKNMYNDKERTYKRKIREWVRAYKVEKLLNDKEAILERYLNVLFVGGQMHGVELGAEYYFDKTAQELTLAQCAYLAGINHMPNAYNPFDETLNNSELIHDRTKTVLNKMLELGFINQEEYDGAIAEVEAGLAFKLGSMPTNVYSYHTDAIIDQLTKQLVEEKNMTTDQAETYIYSSGLVIYSTVDANIQNILEEEFAKKTVKLAGTKNESSQAAMVVIDYKKGEVVGCVGALAEEKTSRGLNRATQTKRQVGSAMKPIATVAPGLQEKIIQVSTVYDDSATEFKNGATPWRPKNYNRFKGLQSIRQFIESSQNIPAAKIMVELTPSLSIEYLEKFGITSLDETEDAVLSLALGGQHNGVSVLDMATAYGTIANGGLRITPTFYSKVLDGNGNEVLLPNKEEVQAVSPQNAYITQQILREPVYGTSGDATATYCAIPGIETGAKTGTTDDNYDRWLCGFTPYYSAAVWFGYDINEKITYGGRNPAGQLWSNAMKTIHASLPNANFTRPEGIIERTVCTTTGLLAGANCPKKTEIFTEDNLPGTCSGHGTQTICSSTNLIATPYCPSTYTRIYGATIPKETLGLWTPLSGASSGQSKINQTCNVHLHSQNTTTTTKPSTNTNTTTNTNTNTNTTTNTNVNTNTNTATPPANVVTPEPSTSPTTTQ